MRKDSVYQDSVYQDMLKVTGELKNCIHIFETFINSVNGKEPLQSFEDAYSECIDYARARQGTTEGALMTRLTMILEEYLKDDRLTNDAINEVIQMAQSKGFLVYGGVRQDTRRVLLIIC